jgi:hypothetical protein
VSGAAAGGDALALARSVAARAGSLDDLAPGCALGLSDEQVDDVRAGGVQAGGLEHVSEAVAILDIAVALGRGPWSPAAALEERLMSAEREVDLARECLVRALRARQACAQEVARRMDEGELIAQAAVLRLVEQAERILRLPAVRRVRIVRWGEQPELEVDTHSLVFEAEGVARSAGRLRFRVMSRPAQVRFAVRDGMPPHPHVMQDGSPCLGHARAPISRALLAGEFEGAITLISGFVMEVDPGSAARRPESFPLSTRLPGWYETTEEGEVTS